MSDSYTLYNETVMDHFMNPRNMGDIKDADAIGEVGAAVCGDIMKITLKIDDVTQTVTDARFKTFGWLFSHCNGCSMSETITCSNDESIKCVLVVEAPKLFFVTG